MSDSFAPVVVVTGGNTGIGLATIQALLNSEDAYTVILCSRDPQKGQAAAQNLEPSVKHGSQLLALQLDIDVDLSIEKFVEEVTTRFGRVDILINNAAVALDGYLAQGAMTARQAWNGVFNTNVTSTHLLTTVLMPLLFAATPTPVQTRIVFITSMSGSHDWCCTAADHPINTPPASGWPKPQIPSLTAYRTSKTAVGMMYREWCRVLANDPIKCHLVCPGHIATSLGGGTPEQARELGAEDPSLAGRFILDVVEGQYDNHAGLNGHLISRYIQGQPVGW